MCKKEQDSATKANPANSEETVPPVVGLVSDVSPVCVQEDSAVASSAESRNLHGFTPCLLFPLALFGRFISDIFNDLMTRVTLTQHSNFNVDCGLRPDNSQHKVPLIHHYCLVNVQYTSSATRLAVSPLISVHCTKQPQEMVSPETLTRPSIKTLVNW